ncbi:biotin/lipoyl-containing protein [Notoacmeibacter sp. MSK16QG-6]|uniref:biotin/lipoyl-containing protein n=1 Tax=Notoacmeibacter sp. MSK16QG-6 TaxID=2957982 RepID=UPI0035315A5E
MAVAAALVNRRSAREPLGQTTGGNLHVGGVAKAQEVFIGDERIRIEANATDDGFAVTAGGDDLGTATLDWRRGAALARMTIGDTLRTIRVDPVSAGYRLRHRGSDLIAKVYSPRVAELAALMPVKEAPDTSNLLLCPMPGLIVSLMVKEGETVQEGQPLAIVEAMKMENVLRAERQATIKRLAVEEGDSLAVDETIMEFETTG